MSSDALPKSSFLFPLPGSSNLFKWCHGDHSEILRQLPGETVGPWPSPKERLTLRREQKPSISKKRPKKRPAVGES